MGSAASNINLVRKVTQVVLLVLGILLVMEQLHYRAAALIAALELASLGVALALQDTLANFFAGIWLAVDRPISRGDFVELETGQAGFVVEVGWRHSKLRTWDDNIVVVPNGRIASAVLVNNSLPSPHTSVYVPCGVAYESDLEQVERVCVEVARQVQRRVEGAVAECEPFLLFREFAGSNTNFAVALRVSDPKALRLVRHEFIKAIKARFDAEGIEINYPVSTVYLRGERRGAAPHRVEHLPEPE
jgi:small-conductance mechanosensitive channel